jgi:hypothetical protein
MGRPDVLDDQNENLADSRFIRYRPHLGLLDLTSLWPGMEDDRTRKKQMAFEDDKGTETTKTKSQPDLRLELYL